MYLSKKTKFACNYFIFLKILFQFENWKHFLRKIVKIWFDKSATQMSIFILFVSAAILFEGAFSLRVSFKNIAFFCKGNFDKTSLCDANNELMGV